MKTVHEFSQEEIFEILVNHAKKKFYNQLGFSLQPGDCEFSVVLNQNQDLKTISFSFEIESVEPIVNDAEKFGNWGYR